MAELDGVLQAEEQHSLLTIARSAAETSQKEYNHVRYTQWPITLSAGMLRCNAEVPFPGLYDYGEYVQRLQVQAEKLHDGVRGFGGFGEASDGLWCVRTRLDEMSDAIERGMLEQDWMRSGG